MSRPVRPPGTPLFHVVTVLLALAAGALTYGVSRPIPKTPDELRQLLADAPVPPHAAVKAVEQGWLAEDDLFLPRYLIANPGPPPCPHRLDRLSRGNRSDRAGISSAEQAVAVEGLALARQGETGQAIARLRQGRGGWLATETLAHVLESSGNAREAQQVLEEYLDQNRTVGTIGDLLTLAKARRPTTGRSLEEVSALIHMLYATGRLQLARNQGGEALWNHLKHPIGLTKFLALRGDVGLVEGVPTTSKLRIPAPGCEASPGSLTSYHLYNNLIVGYLANEDYHDKPPRLAHELERSYADPPSVNPLQTVKNVLQRDWRPEREHWVWAVSNAEALLKENATPTLAALNFNLAQLMVEAVPVVQDSLAVIARGEATASFPTENPPAIPADAAGIVAALEREAVRLMSAAEAQWEGREAVEAASAPVAVVRMQILKAVLAGTPLKLPGRLEILSEEQRAAARAVQTSRELWSAPETWLPEVLAGEEGKIREALGERAPAWTSAARQSGAAALARQAALAEGATREELTDAARLVLRSGDPRPEALTALEKGSGIAALLGRGGAQTVAAVLALLAALLVAAVGYGLSLQRRAQRALFTSFYRLEALQRVRRR
jgi:hypothetical protein